MSKLLSANFMRLRRSKVLLGGAIFMAVLGAFIPFNVWRQNAPYGYSVPLDRVFFGYTLLIGVVLAVFISLFMGTEYSDGAIRNKLVVGHRREAIYMANLVTGMAASVLLALVYIVAVAAVGVPLLGPLTVGASVIIPTLVGTLLMMAAFCGLLTLVSMTCSSKAVAAIINILGVVVLLLLASFVKAHLDAPEFITTYSLIDGALVDALEPNPQYLEGIARTVYEFIYDFLPAGQAIQYSSMSAVHLWQMPLYSLVITVLSTAAGVLLFRRKDLK